MNLTNGKGSMSVAAGSGSWKSSDLEFPAGLRVLVVDDDPTCLMILERMLKQCLYEVTKCNRAENALSMLREKKNGFDIVLSDVHMPDMDGFKLLEHIGLEMDLPVIMMSADDGKNVVMKGVTHGACDYLIKPIRIEALKNIWQHVVRKRRNEWKELEQSGSVDEGDRQQKPQDDGDYSSSVNEGNWKNAKRRKEEEEEAEERDDTSTLKKPRVVWSVELHQQFVAAVNQLGIDKAVPKKILELMNVPGLTRENVASHLQKYRLYLRRISGVSQHQGGVNGSFIGTQDAAFSQMSSLSGLDLQALAVAGQLPAQSLATLQAAGFGRATSKPGIPIPLIDQNVFSFNNPKLRFGEGQQQQIIGSNKQVNLLHGIPTTVEPKQLVNLQQSTQSFANTSMQVHSQGAQSSSLLMHMAQPQSRGQILSDNTGSQIPRLPMNVGQPFLSNDIAGGVLSRNGTSENGRGTAYNMSQPSSTSTLALNHGTELPTSTFPLGNAPVLPSFPSKGGFQDNINPGMKGSGAFMGSYDILSDLQQIRSNDWEISNVGLTFDASQHATNVQGNLDPSPPSTVPSGFSSGQSIGQSRNQSPAGKPVFLPEGTQQGNLPNDGQQLNSLISNPIRIKSEALSDSSYPSLLYPEHIGQDDLMSVLLKQQQQGTGSANTEFDFDVYSIDGIPE